MTTIAYNHKEGVVAFDSRLSAGGTIITDDYDKSFLIGDDIFIWTGAHHDVHKFKNNFPNFNDGENLDCRGILIRDEKAHLFTFEDGNYIECELEYSYCIGSGSDHAYTAIDFGATAEEAILASIKRDLYTGGQVNKISVVRDKELPI